MTDARSAAHTATTWLHHRWRVHLDAHDGTALLIGAARDGTAEMAALAALEASEETFRTAMESVPSGIALLDDQRHFIAVNSALCDILRRDRGWLLAHGMADVIHSDDDDACRAPVPSNGHRITITLSVGGAFAEPDDDPESLLQRADRALYRSKREGRNCLRMYDPPLDLSRDVELRRTPGRVREFPEPGTRVLTSDNDGLEQSRQAGRLFSSRLTT